MARNICNVPFECKRDSGLIAWSSTGVGQILCLPLNAIVGIAAVVKRIQHNYWKKQATKFQSLIEKKVKPENIQKYQNEMTFAGEKSDRAKKTYQQYTKWIVMISMGAIPFVGAFYGYRVAQKINPPAK